MIWPLDIDFWINLIAGTLETYAATKIIIGVNALLVPIFWGHFYFDPYISILLLLVPKTKQKNAFYFGHYLHSLNRKILRGK